MEKAFWFLGGALVDAVVYRWVAGPPAATLLAAPLAPLPLPVGNTSVAVAPAPGPTSSGSPPAQPERTEAQNVLQFGRPVKFQ